MLTSTLISGRTQEMDVSSKITDVTVFLSGAQITREARTTLSPGVTDVVLTDLSYYIQPASIQVDGNNDFTIISVKHVYDYEDDRQESAEVLAIREELEGLNRQLRILNSTEKIYGDEKSMILANKSISGTRVGADVETVIDLADFYEERLKEIEYKFIEIQTARTDLNEQINELNQELNQITGGSTYTSNIVVSLSTSSTKKVTISFNYVVTQAGWSPLYDIRSNDINGPITLTYKGNVWQQTGYDWNDVNIKLSTGNPTQSGTRPTMYPWVVSLYDPNEYREQYERNDNSSDAYAVPSISVESEVDEMYYLDDYLYDATTSLANYTTVSQTAVNTTFNIALPYTIPTDGIAYAVEVQDHEIPATYAYYSAPKVDCDAFLMARITGWDDLNLMAGTANIFYEGTYVGQSYLNTNVTDDTLQVSLGRDNSVIVERQKIKGFEATQTIGSNTKLTIAIELNVRNNKNGPISIKLDDQIPISSNKDIVVTLIDDGGATLDATTGKLTWNLDLAKGESTSLRFTYSIKYPKDQELNNY